MTDQLQLRDWQQMCQAKAAHYAAARRAITRAAAEMGAQL